MSGAQLRPEVALLEWLESAALSQDSANLLPQKPSLLPPVPNTWTPPPNMIQMVADTVQNPTISAPLLSCLNTSSPTKFTDLATSLCLLRK